MKLCGLKTGKSSAFYISRAFNDTARAETAWQMPSCIIRPRSTKHLQKVIPRLVASNVSFTVRSGGHCPHAGAGNIDNGILIDLSYFDRLKYDKRKGVVEIGTGLRWGEVYTQLDAHQVTVVGGRVAHVGVGGLTLGGKSVCENCPRL